MWPGWCGPRARTDTKVRWRVAVEWCIFVSRRLSRKDRYGDGRIGMKKDLSRGVDALPCVMGARRPGAIAAPAVGDARHVMGSV
jgi:hypothetical protein